MATSKKPILKIPNSEIDLVPTGFCPECDGEGVIWCFDEKRMTHWAERCKFCNCCGVIYDLPNSWKRELGDSEEVDQEDVPF